MLYRILRVTVLWVTEKNEYSITNICRDVHRTTNACNIVTWVTKSLGFRDNFRFSATKRTIPCTEAWRCSPRLLFRNISYRTGPWCESGLSKILASISQCVHAAAPMQRFAHAIVKRYIHLSIIRRFLLHSSTIVRQFIANEKESLFGFRSTLIY